MLHHDCDSSGFNWIRFDPTKNEIHLSFKPDGKVHVYSAPPGHDNPALVMGGEFENVRRAKTRNAAIGNEKPGSEGSYIVHHIVGLKGQPAPYPFREIEDEKVLA